MGKVENLKPGDKVFVSGRFGRSLHTVEKITPKGFIKVNGSLYNQNGYERGGDPWSFTSIHPASEEEIIAYNKERFVVGVMKKLKEIKSLDYEKAVLIHDILFKTE